MLNNNSNAEKMLSWVDFEGTCAKLINAVKIMYLCSLMWLKPNLNLVSNFSPKRWWILFLRSEIDRLTLSKVFLNFLKDFALLNGKSSCFCHLEVQLRESLYFFVTTLQEFDSLKILLLKKRTKTKGKYKSKTQHSLSQFLGEVKYNSGKNSSSLLWWKL